MDWQNITAEQATRWAEWLWWFLAAVWLVLLFWRKTEKRKETPLERLEHITPMALGLWLVFNHTWIGDWLERIVVPRMPGILWSGVLLTALGVAISIWARLILGTNWSGMVTLKDDHELIRKGPYRWIRHPIYTGILVGVVGTALIEGRMRGWAGLLIILGSFYYKAKREESFLRQEFGEGFEEHARHTGMFLPKLT